MQKGSRSPFYRQANHVARKIKNERRAAIARATMASSASTSDTCDWHPRHGADDKPQGARCGAAATHRIVWLDGSKRYSLACGAHLELDKIAPRRKVEPLTSPRSAATSKPRAR